jgi:hypothetical protein
LEYPERYVHGGDFRNGRSVSTLSRVSETDPGRETRFMTRGKKKLSPCYWQMKETSERHQKGGVHINITLVFDNASFHVTVQANLIKFKKHPSENFSTP